MKIKSSAPGRICLFGEHQDYLGFPVIAAGIDLRVTIDGEVYGGDSIHLDLPDVKKTLAFHSGDIRYTGSKDYLKSVVNVLKKEKLYEPRGIHAVVKGNVPIQAGTASSAALSVAWTGFLLEASETDVVSYLENPAAAAELAHKAEVEEFDESGGRMDQYTSAIGGIVYLDFYDEMTVQSLPIGMNGFVLGDSLQPKDTQRTLARCRAGQEGAFLELAHYLKFKDNFHVTYEEAEPYFEKISPEKRPYLKAALMNHEITREAKAELLKKSPDIDTLARLMNRHHECLRDDLRVSTPKLEAMIEKSMLAGALAAKINGSGEGGCMFAFCPGKQEAVAEAVREAGGVPYIINVGKGLDVYNY
ncbi:MAG: GHMP kinase [bacterium]|nr:GHMP kinase [bacterium]